MRVTLIRNSFLRMVFLLPLLVAIMADLSAEAYDQQQATTPQKLRPDTNGKRTPAKIPKTQVDTIRWSTAQKNVLSGMQTLSADGRFSQLARRYEKEVRVTSPALKAAQTLLKNPTSERSASSDVIRRLEQQKEVLSKLQNQMLGVAKNCEAVRKTRILCSSQFENANQKATQYINMLASVLKALREMGSSSIKNML